MLLVPRMLMTGLVALVWTDNPPEPVTLLLKFSVPVRLKTRVPLLMIGAVNPGNPVPRAPRLAAVTNLKRARLNRDRLVMTLSASRISLPEPFLVSEKTLVSFPPVAEASEYWSDEPRPPEPMLGLNSGAQRHRREGKPGIVEKDIITLGKRYHCAGGWYPSSLQVVSVPICIGGGPDQVGGSTALSEPECYQGDEEYSFHNDWGLGLLII